MKTTTDEIETTERWFPSANGESLFYREWQPSTEATGRALLLLHRGHEHSGRMDEVARHFASRGFHCFAYDARGHGRSPGRRGDAPSIAAWIRDLDAFARHIRSAHGIEPDHLAVIANSVAAVVAAGWVHDCAPGIRAMALVAPAFRINLYVPGALAGLRLAGRLRQKLFVKSYVRPSMLTSDRAQAASYAADPLITREIAAHLLVDLHGTATRIIDDAATIETPTIVLSAGKDWVVRSAPQRRFHERLGSDRKQFVKFTQMRHAMLHEWERVAVIQRIERFFEEVFDSPPVRPGLRARRATADEYHNLQMPARGLRGFGFAAQRVALRTIGSLSEGVRIGWRDGFDSGTSLDYVYENRARGVGPLGRLMDRAYLDSPGWRGIRQRKDLLQDAVRECLRGNPACRFADLAAGPGRYLLEVLGEHPEASALLRDWNAKQFDITRQLLAEQGIRTVRCEQGDAFDEDAVAGIDPAPDVVIVSGLYELFPDNEAVLRSLRGIVRLLPANGRLIYTCQPWHPQLELIARVLPNREGKPWIMRRRSQAEMDALVQSVGFTKERTAADDQGIFTVSIARKGDLQ